MYKAATGGRRCACRARRCACCATPLCATLLPGRLCFSNHCNARQITCRCLHLHAHLRTNHINYWLTNVPPLCSDVDEKMRCLLALGYAPGGSNILATLKLALSGDVRAQVWPPAAVARTLPLRVPAAVARTLPLRVPAAVAHTLPLWVPAAALAGREPAAQAGSRHPFGSIWTSGLPLVYVPLTTQAPHSLSPTHSTWLPPTQDMRALIVTTAASAGRDALSLTWDWLGDNFDALLTKLGGECSLRSAVVEAWSGVRRGGLPSSTMH